MWIFSNNLQGARRKKRKMRDEMATLDGKEMVNLCIHTRICSRAVHNIELWSVKKCEGYICSKVGRNGKEFDCQFVGQRWMDLDGELMRVG